MSQKQAEVNPPDIPHRTPPPIPRGTFMTRLGRLVNRHPKLKRHVLGIIESAPEHWKAAKAGFRLLLSLGKMGFWLLLFLGIVFAFFAFFADFLIYLAPSSTYGYAIKYSVDNSNVTINQRPHDCEWGSAPLGDKHCHYAPKLEIVRTSDGKIGTPIVSFDEGTTWQVHEELGVRYPSVFVSWTKVDE